MNRRNILKTAALSPLAAIPAIAEEPWSKELHGLFEFQKEIWRDYHTYDYNLFLLPRQGGKNYMTGKIVGGWTRHPEASKLERWARESEGQWFRRHDGEMVFNNPNPEFLEQYLIDPVGVIKCKGSGKEIPKLTILMTHTGHHGVVKNWWNYFFIEHKLQDFWTHSSEKAFNAKRFGYCDLHGERYYSKTK